MVASDQGVYLRKVVSFRPGNGGRNPFCRARSIVDCTGKYNAAWAKVTKSSGFVRDGMVAMAFCTVGTCKCHRPCVRWFRIPWRMSLPWCSMETSVLVKCALQPASHNCPMEMRLVSASAGKMYALRADLGREGIGKYPSWVFCIVR